jgi:hypothetical protein
VDRRDGVVFETLEAGALCIAEASLLPIDVEYHFRCGALIQLLRATTAIDATWRLRRRRARPTLPRRRGAGPRSPPPRLVARGRDRVQRRARGPRSIDRGYVAERPSGTRRELKHIDASAPRTRVTDPWAGDDCFGGCFNASTLAWASRATLAPGERLGVMLPPRSIKSLDWLPASRFRRCKPHAALAEGRPRDRCTPARVRACAVRRQTSERLPRPLSQTQRSLRSRQISTQNRPFLTGLPSWRMLRRVNAELRLAPLASL